LGLGTALLARCVSGARERDDGPVPITSNLGDTPKHM
jgi:hypothetical protein